MITIVHGGQTGVDRGGHTAARENGWSVAGYMTSDGRDELGPIPPDVARFLAPHDRPDYNARTEANVQSASAALIMVCDTSHPRTTPGTTKTIDLVEQRGLPYKIVDPRTNAAQIARWIWTALMPRSLMLPIEGFQLDTAATRLLVAGPRESKWPGACQETTAFLGHVGRALAEIHTPAQDGDLPQERR